MLNEVKLTLQLLGWELRREELNFTCKLGKWKQTDLPLDKVIIEQGRYGEVVSVKSQLIEFKRGTYLFMVWLCEDWWELRLMNQHRDSKGNEAGHGLESFCQLIAKMEDNPDVC